MIPLPISLLVVGILGLDLDAADRESAPPRPTPLQPAAGTTPDHPRARGEPGGYLVVRVGLDGEGPNPTAFRDVAAEIAGVHRAVSEVDWDGREPSDLLAALRAHRPRNVLFVVLPEVLDVNLHRRILQASVTLDDDPFPDFAFGYFTARDGTALRALWKRTLALHAGKLRNEVWESTAVTSGKMRSWTQAESIPPLAKAAGFQGSQTYFAIVESDPSVRDFLPGALSRLERASVISLTGNGDPQGIWLFDGRRNLDRSKHWDFDPKRVGEDPEGVLPRITAADIRKLTLERPVVWSGTCHSGATHRVYVEGDIVSTFGRTTATTVYAMPPDESLCLAFLDAGAAALLVPVASNHGMAVSREQLFALREGATLGEIIKATYDDVFLQAQGQLRLTIQEEGARPSHRTEPIMQGGGANRILIGDPSLALFPKTPDTSRTVTVTRAEDALAIALVLRKGFHADAWDMYGSDRARDWRVYARVPLPDDLTDLAPATATVAVRTPEGEPIPATLTRIVVEDDHGRRWLHVQANGRRSDLSDRALDVRFRVARH